MSNNLWTEEQFNCPVCLDLPNDPVTIPCGHSYCMACIKDYWTKDDPKGIYSCPQCRQTFCPKPSLSRNTMLADAVEQLRKGALKSDVRDSIRSARMSMMSVTKSKGTAKLSTSAVPCNMCHGQPHAAIKSCLVCMSSYCETHLKPHKTQKALMQHELIAPTGNLSEKICTQHKYLQEFVCHQCNVFVCWLCTSNQHKDHECVSTKTERLEKQKVLADIQTENQQRLKAREQELKDMKTMMDVVTRSTGKVQDDIEQVLLDLQRSVERLQELVEEVLEQTSLDKLNQAQEVTENLEAEIKVLKKRDTEMKDLARCEDHIHYLQTYESMCSPLESGDLPNVVVNKDASFEPIRDAILDLRDKVEDLCNQELSNITKQVKETTLFTLGDSNRTGPKAGLLKLFSSLGSRNSSSRSPASFPSISVGGRSIERRGLGFGSRNPDVRSRDTPRDRGNSSSSPRLQERRRRDDRDSMRDTNPRPSPSPASSHRESLWNRSNRSLAVPAANLSPVAADPTPAPAPTPSAAPASTGGFSRMASINSSISSMFRSHRRNATPATPATPSIPATPATPATSLTPATPAMSSMPATPFAGGNPWAMDALSETPTEVNPSLFLDLPSSDTMNHTPVFPALKEINIDSIQAPEPRTREEFLQYSVPLCLDTNSAHKRLVLSEDNTKATLQVAAQPYPDTPQRFECWTQVMCQGPLSAGRCYWEVEWRGRGSSMGVAYGSLNRKCSDSRAGLGYNCQSWTLELSDTCCSAMYDNKKKDIPVTYSPRVGIYVDMSAGTLAFYSVADSMTHLHTFRANFTQPLYAAFGVGSGIGVGLDFALGKFSSGSDSIKICQ